MKKLALVLVSVLFAAGVALAVVDKPATQCDLAKMLANAMGLSEALPADADCAQYFAILKAIGVEPIGGWNETAKVTPETLSYVLVQAAKLDGQVKNPKDPKSYIALLKEKGVSVGEASKTIKDSGKLLPNYVSRDEILMAVSALGLRHPVVPPSTPIF